jgi:type I restriction enzyme S subunit
VPSHKVSNLQILKRGDILIAASSGSLSIVGKAGVFKSDEKYTFGAFCKAIRPRTNIDASYLSHYFFTTEYRTIISSLAAGANINNLRNEHIDNLSIPLPPLAEQQRIAELLDTADRILKQRESAIAKLDQLAQSVFVEMFGDPLANSKNFEKSF